MSFQTRTLPVRKWYVRLEDGIVDEEAARQAWVLLVKAQGWSPVGEPEVVREVTPAVVGRMVEYPGLTVSPDVRDFVVVAL